MNRIRIPVAVLLLVSSLAAGPVTRRAPFPANIPLEHFSYVRYPTDVLGFMDCPEGAEITPEGNIYTGYTELIFLHDNGSCLAAFPLRTHYWLENEYLPIHYWEREIKGILYRFNAFAAPLDLNPGNNLIVFLEVTVTNKSGKKETPCLAVGTRYSPTESEGSGRYAPGRHRFRRPESPIRPGLYRQEGQRFSSRWTFEFRGNALLRKGRILYTFASDIAPRLFSYRGYPGEVGKTFEQPVIASSPVGIVRFSRVLNPGESFSIFIKMPYTPVDPSSADAEKINELKFSTMKERVTDFWEDLLARGMQVELPEQKPVHVYKASLIYDLIARDKIGEDYIQAVNEFHYDSFWLRDSAYIVRSYDLGGYHDIARQCLEFFFRWQREDGNFLSQGGQYDGWGQTLWAFGQHYRLTRDKAFGEKALTAVMKAAGWLENQINLDPLGIVPRSTPGDNENIEGGHVTGHNFWALAGLKNAIFMARGLNKPAEAEKLKSLYKRLNRNLYRELKEVLRKTGNYIPPGLDKPGGQDWGNLMAVYPEEILPPDHPAVSETLKRSRQKYREKIMTYGDGQYLHHYLTMKNTETLIIRGDQEEALDDFYAVLAHTGATQAGFEFSIRPWSDRDFHANLTPHGWFAATYRNMLRSMLVRENDDTLHLLSVISPAWAVEGRRIKVKSAPTYFGEISFTGVFTADGLELEIDPDFFHSPKTIAVHLPYFVQFVDAGTGEFKNNVLYISPNTGDVVIKWRRKTSAPFFSYEAMVKWLREEYEK